MTQTEITVHAEDADPAGAVHVTVTEGRGATGPAGADGQDGAPGPGAADADATTKGVLRLTGDLAGTADSPTVPGLATEITARAAAISAEAATRASADAGKASTTHAATHAAAGSDPVTLTSAQLSDLTETVQDIVGALLVAGSGVTVSYNDGAGTFTINATTGTVTDPETVRDTIAAALVAGAGVQVTVNDPGDTITVASTAVLPTRQVASGTGLSGGGDLSADRTLSVTYGTTAGTATQGDDARVTGAAQQAANLSDLASASTARTNLGLGDAATHAASDFAAADVSGLPDPTGHSHDQVLGLDATGAPVWRWPTALIYDPATSEQFIYISDIGAYTGTGNGIDWYPGIVDGDDLQGMRVFTGPTNNHSMKFLGDGVLQVNSIPVVLDDDARLTGGSVAAADITDATATGIALITATDAAAARAATGAGTSNLVLGTSSSTAKAGDYAPAWTEITSKPSTFAPSAHTHPATDISDSTATGRAVLTAADAAAARTAIGAGTGSGTSNLVVGTTAGTAAEGNDSRIVGAVPSTRTVSAGTGLTGGGDLSANRTLTVAYGTSGTTAAVGNDTRITGALQAASNLSDVATPATALTNLGGVATGRQVIAGTGLTGGGTLAADRTLTVAYGTSSTTAAVGNDSRITGALQAANNLSDVTAATARTNLGLGTAAVTNTGTGSSNTILGNDARLTDARTPAAHAASHAAGQSDALTLTAAQLSDFTEATQDVVGALVTAGSGITATYDDSGNTETLSVGPVTANVQTGTSYTLVLTDAPKFVTMSNASASTLTVPPNSSVAFPTGTVIDGAQLGAGQVTLTPGSGVTINATPGLKVAAQYGSFALIKTATDTWLAVGRLSA